MDAVAAAPELDRVRRADKGVGGWVKGGEEEREVGGMGPNVRGVGAVGGGMGEVDMVGW